MWRLKLRLSTSLYYSIYKVDVSAAWWSLQTCSLDNLYLLNESLYETLKKFLLKSSQIDSDNVSQMLHWSWSCYPYFSWYALYQIVIYGILRLKLNLVCFMKEIVFFQTSCSILATFIFKFVSKLILLLVVVNSCI